MKRTVSVLLTALLLLNGCQAQPHVPTAMNGAERLIEQALAAPWPGTEEDARQSAETGRSPLYAKLGVPERFAPIVDSGSDALSVEVDAKVVLPDVDKLPMLKVKPAQFSQKTVDALFKLLCGDTRMYDTSASGHTRESLERNLEMWRERLDDEDALMREDAKGMVELLEAQLAAMPGNVEDMVSTARLREMVYSFGTPDVGRYMGVNAVERPEDAYEMGGKRFMVHNDFHRMDWEDRNIDFGPETGARITYFDGDTMLHANGANTYTLVDAAEDVPKEALESLGMAPEEAAGLVQAAMDGAGLELAVDNVWLNTRREYSKTVVDGAAHYSEPTADSPASYTYMVTLGQVLGGAATRSVYEAEANNRKNLSSMEPAWFYQRIGCEVYDGAIQSFSWAAPVEVCETVTQDAALLPFDTIADVFHALIPLRYGEENSDPDLRRLEIRIDRVELEMQRVTPDGSVSEGLLVPVWNFYGKLYSVYDWGTRGADGGLYDFPRALLTINAIDGSVIDIFEGY